MPVIPTEKYYERTWLYLPVLYGSYEQPRCMTKPVPRDDEKAVSSLLKTDSILQEKMEKAEKNYQA